MIKRDHSAQQQRRDARMEGLGSMRCYTALHQSGAQPYPTFRWHAHDPLFRHRTPNFKHHMRG
ncbi:hypothetical protein CWC46_16940 [Prodigiosinella confusarubida]|uniref:Uncharacterized protein n=1 Tax=Serratia sp. (strain ATCC 39006) TaxID=104623 RepID=A0A2I5T9Y8_SERS3|nr:hypothetical protein CWC46_16940 [Serratia sp. ATCC 39006]AUH05663.1 hypothetical protein Ser39006_016940 [Serratia sp. ATCC 39006]